MTDPNPNLDAQTVQDMAGDIEDSIAFGDAVTSFYSDGNGTPYDWFSTSADDEYQRRTGTKPEAGSVAAAIYAIITSPEGQADIAEEQQENESFEEALDDVLEGDTSDF